MVDVLQRREKREKINILKHPHVCPRRSSLLNFLATELRQYRY